MIKKNKEESKIMKNEKALKLEKKQIKKRINR